MLGATVARLRPGKSGLLLPLLWPLAVAEAEVVSPQRPLFPTPALVAWAMPWAPQVVRPLVAPRVARAWVATVGPTRPLPKAQEPVAAEVVPTLPTPAALAALAATPVAEAVVAGLRSKLWPRALEASVASGWPSSFPMQSEEQNA